MRSADEVIGRYNLADKCVGRDDLILPRKLKRYLLCFPHKPFSAFRAGDLDPSLSPRDAEQVAAAGAPEEFVGMPALQAGENRLELLPDRPPEPEEFVVFRPPAPDISRKHPEEGEDQQQVR